jgi:tryptophan-rich sensory protein
MTFSVADGSQLVVWIIFVFWEPYGSIGNKARDWYTKRSGGLKGYIVPWYIFPFVWTILKGLIVASIFLFFKSLTQAAVDAVDYRYLTVYILFVVNVLIAKLWTVLFFKYRLTRAAFWVAFIIFATAVVVVVFMGISSDIIVDIAYLSMALYIPYVAWLAFALYLNYNWLRMEEVVIVTERRPVSNRKNNLRETPLIVEYE